MEAQVGDIALCVGVSLTVGRGIYKGQQRDKPRVDTYTLKQLEKVDYPLLIIFIGQFIQIQGLVGTGTPKCMWNAAMGWDTEGPPPLGGDFWSGLAEAYTLSFLVLFLANTISNVPLVRTFNAPPSAARLILLLCAYM